MIIAVIVMYGVAKENVSQICCLILLTIWRTQPPNLAHNDFHILHLITQNYGMIALEMCEQ
jgi:hypothetical protein